MLILSKHLTLLQVRLLRGAIRCGSGIASRSVSPRAAERWSETVEGTGLRGLEQTGEEDVERVAWPGPCP
jgi:hypothetical protein